MHKRIFISKNASEVAPLNDYLVSQGKTLIASSFLQFSQLEFELNEQYDVIFFGSPRAIFFFKSQFEIPESVEIACVGSTTAEIIESLNRKVSFSGEHAAGIQEVAQSFKSWCGDKKVLFPISSLSLKTISSQFGPEQKIEVEVYQTSIVSREIDPCDVYVFTSPSNVKGFLDVNSIPNESVVIA